MAGWLTAMCAVVHAYDMGSDFIITSDTQSWGLDNPAQTIDGVGYVWTFPDAGGLNMKPGATYKVSNTANGSGFTLDLAGGAITGGGDLTTKIEAAIGKNGPITITNAGNIAVGLLATDIDDNGGGGGETKPISVTHAGSFSASTVSTFALNTKKSGSQSFTGDGSGSFSITTSGMDSYGSVSGSGDITILAYNNVSVTGGIKTGLKSWGGHVSIGTGGSPIIGPVTVSGGIDSAKSSAGSGGSIGIYAAGNIQITGAIQTYQDDGQNNGLDGGSITLSSTGGTISTEAIDTHTAATHQVPSNRAYGGNVNMTSAGDINITGAINLHSSNGTAYEGNLTLTASGASSKVSLVGLDMDKVRVTTLTSGGGKSYITGVLAGFDRDNPGNGALVSGSSGTIIYDEELAGNAYLTDGYTGIYNLSGGGVLKFETPSSTVLIVR